MRILALTDFGGEFPENLFKNLKKEKFDFGVVSGDLADIKKIRDYFFKYGKNWEKNFSKEEIENIRLEGVEKVSNICDKLESLGKPIYIVGGNNELIKYDRFKEILSNYRNCKLLDDEWTTHDNIHIFGYFDKGRGDEISLPGKIDESLNSKLKKYNENVLLLSHYPPFGIRLDKLPKTNPVSPGEHIGSTKLKFALENASVSMVICGHLEENIGEDKIRKTRIINPGSADKENYSLIEFDEKIEDSKILYK